MAAVDFASEPKTLHPHLVCVYVRFRNRVGLSPTSASEHLHGQEAAGNRSQEHIYKQELLSRGSNMKGLSDTET